ncbi:TIR domain-containing protein [Caldibacillus debilis]|uniref:Putative nucleotide-binding protein containing TIR-like domain n=1 Tax=Caldibacillus debilis GB1 TaxID=1339248 RepID=A0A420VI19_9BACI|nr:nucleotide-binding protein [Caldibacillus debilis]RKO63176.1 putative nucleotide-binding protein containing TIR-like domain [Caldibacillus debilis GB1]
MTTPKKPKTFIGSSREAKKLVAAVHSQIKYHTEVTPWYNAFPANEYTMEALEKELNESDFGIFVFAPDDIALHRGKYVYIPRDNTIFEAGLFWGKLGRGRVFAIIPEQVKERDDLIIGATVNEFHLLSDLQGLTLLRYEQRTDNNFEAAVSVACQRIIDKIEELGFFQDPRSLLDQKAHLLRFFWEYNRLIKVANTKEKYEALCEAVRNSFLTPDGFRITGAAFWLKQGNEGIGHVGGNVGRGRFFPFNQHNVEDGRKIYVLDAYFSGKWVYYRRKTVEETYVLCYPLTQEHVLSVHFSGSGQLRDPDLTNVVNINNELFNTITHLIGGDSK